MARIHGGEMLVRALEREGVGQVFTLHGGHLDAIFDACLRHSLGVTDTVTGVANAYMDSIPMLLIGGRSPLADDELLPLQGGIDQMGLMRPITKWAYSVTQVARIPEFVAMRS